MKKVFILLVLFVCVISTAQARTFGYTSFRNAVAAGFSTEITTSNGVYFTYSVEYTRHVKGGFFWGVTGSFREHMGHFITYSIDHDSHRDPYGNTLSMDIPTLTGMAYYELPLCKWLAFRGGAGIGLGYHIMKDEDAEIYKDKVAPYFQMKLQWVVRPWKRVEICLAPLLIGPSSGAIAPWVFGPPSDQKILAYLNLINIQIGVRF